jgi:hypothetical protein
MSPDPPTEAQRKREFSAPPDIVREPPPGDPSFDPPGTVRVQVWAERLQPHVRRAMRTDHGRWLLFTGEPVKDALLGRNLGNNHVRDWPVSSLMNVAVAYRHTEHERLIHKGPQDFGTPAAPMSSDGGPVSQGWTLPGNAPAAGGNAPMRLDGSDAEGDAPFKDKPRREGNCTACGRPFTPDHDADAPGPTVRHIFKAPR